MLGSMFAILRALGMFIADLFKSRRRLEAENLFLRHQLSIALRHAPPRLRLRGSDRALLVWMTRLSFPKIRSGRIRAVRENQTIIQCDGCDHLPAWNIYRRSAQVAAPA
jgi:hypothetical protein